MAIEWKDVTSYSQGQREKIEPTAWECRIEGIRIWVSCGHIYYPGQWIMNCDALDIDKKHLAATGEIPVSAVLAKALRIAGITARERSERLAAMAEICEAQP